MAKRGKTPDTHGQADGGVATNRKYQNASKNQSAPGKYSHVNSLTPQLKFPIVA
jgi:hypothetical protein